MEIEAQKPETGSEVLQHQIQQETTLACARSTTYDKVSLSTVFTQTYLRASHLTIHDTRAENEVECFPPCSAVLSKLVP